MTRRILFVMLCALAAVAVGCGNKHHEVTAADTEGIWIDVGHLDYHIQGSRQLNPYVVPDDRYLTGLPSDVGQPTGTETWFAVFLRIENKTDEAAKTATEFEIEDTDGEIYTPVAIDTKVNPFAYLPQTLGPKQAMPHPDSSQEVDSTQGSMLLFKLPLSSYQNRPLAFRIKAPDGPEPHEAHLDLDV
jgi:hypothetical protein